MRKITIIISILLSTIGCLNAHSVFKIKIKHSSNHKAKDIIVLNFDEVQASYINDTMAIYSYSPNIPTNVLIILNRAERWHTFAWLFPDKDTVELMVDFETKKTQIKNPKAWDIVHENYSQFFDDGEIAKADQYAETYITANKDSYMSLWLLSHGAAHHNRPLKTKLFNLLADNLKSYKEYKEVESDLKNRKIPTTGQSFKDFSLKNINQSTFTSNTISNKIIVLHFWTNMCGPCVKGIDELVQFNSRLDTSKIKMISICFDENKDTWQAAASSHKINWTNLWQSDGIYCDLCLHYNLSVMPLFVVFNKDKKLETIIEGEDLVGLQREITRL